MQIASSESRLSSSSQPILPAAGPQEACSVAWIREGTPRARREKAPHGELPLPMLLAIEERQAVPAEELLDVRRHRVLADHVGVDELAGRVRPCDDDRRTTQHVCAEDRPWAASRASMNPKGFLANESVFPTRGRPSLPGEAGDRLSSSFLPSGRHAPARPLLRVELLVRPREFPRASLSKGRSKPFRCSARRRTAGASASSRNRCSSEAGRGCRRRPPASRRARGWRIRRPRAARGCRELRNVSWSARAAPARARSPDAWPNRSLIRFRPSTSARKTIAGRPILSASRRTPVAWATKPRRL